MPSSRPHRLNNCPFSPVRSWGRSRVRRHQTPLVRVNGRRFRVNIMSAIASRGALWFTVFTGTFDAKVFIAFLDRLARQAGGKVYVIADRHPVHRSKKVTAWLAGNSDRIELHLMPGYSPNSTPTRSSTPTSNATSTPPGPAQQTTSPTRPGASSTAASNNPASSAATSTHATSATPWNRQPNSFDSISAPRPQGIT
ncbi:transposase [Streptomyces sp. NPDC046161]|uniref:transposase n=1 Tax=Streptomyces sp. NPDC046161 TaxID=3155132 RepID=UPI0033DA807C